MEDLLSLKKRQIFINHQLSIMLYEQTLFKADGGEGLHLWEASVVLTRYCIKNKNLFDNKAVIDIGTGCGLLGISLLLQTNLNKLSFSDYNSEVLDNLKENIKLNIRDTDTSRYDIQQFDWRQYNEINLQYDIIVGSELIYQGGYIEELAKLIKKILKPNGICLISMPLKRSMTNKFLSYLDNNSMKHSAYHFNDEKDENLFVPVLKTANKLFEDLKKMDLMLYKIEHK